MVKIGFDLDGIIAVGTIKRTHINLWKYYGTCNATNIEKNFPNNEIIIITGRKPRFEKLTIEWLKKYKVKYDEIYFYDGKERTFENLAKYKAKWIKNLGIEQFFEDTPWIGCKIKKEVTNCKMYLIFESTLLEIR